MFQNDPFVIYYCVQYEYDGVIFFNPCLIFAIFSTVYSPPLHFTPPRLKPYFPAVYCSVCTCVLMGASRHMCARMKISWYYTQPQRCVCCICDSFEQNTLWSFCPRMSLGLPKLTIQSTSLINMLLRKKVCCKNWTRIATCSFQHHQRKCAVMLPSTSQISWTQHNVSCAQPASGSSRCY